MRCVVVVVWTLGVAAAMVGCGGDGDDEAGTPTLPPAVTPGVATATPEADLIRAVDLQNSEPVQDLIEVTGGLYVQGDVLYADLTDDDEDEAVVPLSSGGTLGDVGFLVLQLTDGAVEPLLTVTPESGGGLSVSISGGQLVSVEPVPGPDDPECCPSSLRTTVYGWDGEDLVVESSKTEPSTGGGAKTPEGQ
jgi:hypothetical protein